MLGAGAIAFLVAFGAVVVGWALSLDYSAKLFVMTFVLVVMGSEGPSGAPLPCAAPGRTLLWASRPCLQGLPQARSLLHLLAPCPRATDRQGGCKITVSNVLCAAAGARRSVACCPRHAPGFPALINHTR